MKFLQKTITFPEREYAEEREKLANLLLEYEKKLKAYERFEDDVRDVMDFMDDDVHRENLNHALARLR